MAEHLPPQSSTQEKFRRTVNAARAVARIPIELRTGAPDDVLYPITFGSAFAEAVFTTVRWFPGVMVEMILTGHFLQPNKTDRAPGPPELRHIGLNLARAWCGWFHPARFGGSPRIFARAIAALRYALKAVGEHTPVPLWGPLGSGAHDHLDRGLGALAFVVTQSLMTVFDPTGFTNTGEPEVRYAWNGLLDGRDLGAALYQLYQPLPDPYICAVLTHRFLSLDPIPP